MLYNALISLLSQHHYPFSWDMCPKALYCLSMDLRDLTKKLYLNMVPYFLWNLLYFVFKVFCQVQFDMIFSWDYYWECIFFVSKIFYEEYIHSKYTAVGICPSFLYLGIYGIVVALFHWLFRIQLRAYTYMYRARRCEYFDISTKGPRFANMIYYLLRKCGCYTHVGTDHKKSDVSLSTRALLFILYQCNVEEILR